MSLAQRTPLSLEFEALWSAARPDGVVVPTNDDIDLTRFASFLPNLIKVEVDTASRTMPIRLLGSALRDLIGQEVTGENFLDLINFRDSDLAWKSRLIVHDQPCGRFEIVAMDFPGDRKPEGSFTTLPIWGTGNERMFLTLAEPLETVPSLINNQTAGDLHSENNFSFFDIGAGLPDLSVNNQGS